MENPRDRGACWAAIYGVAQSQTRLMRLSSSSSSPTLCNPMDCQAPLSSTSSQSLLKFMSIEAMKLSNHLILCCPLLFFPLVFPIIRVFSNESVLCIRWPKYWSFSFNFSISPNNEYSMLISFRFDRLDLLAVQVILKSLLQQHSLKTSVLWC